jgi:CRP-like cAMP-binding protein
MNDATPEPTLFDKLLELRRQGGPLARLTEEELREFECDLEEIRCDVDHVLILRGEAVDRVFIVLEGRLVASAKGSDGDEKIVRELIPGDLGEDLRDGVGVDASVPAFDLSQRDLLRQLESEVELRTLAGGETLFHQANSADAAHIVMSGGLTDR